MSGIGKTSAITRVVNPMTMEALSQRLRRGESKNRITVNCMRLPNKKSGAFTRWELAATIAACALCACVVLPVAATKTVSERTICANNLRQLGQALEAWAGDHGNRLPWYVPLAQGGSSYIPRAGNVWVEVSPLSNHVSSRVLTCPADLRSRPWIQISETWSNLFTKRDNSTSYHIALHSGAYLPEEAGIVLTDLNLRFDTGPTSCSSGVNNAMAAMTSAASVTQWTNNIHGETGHVLRRDGSVEYTDTARLRELLQVTVTTGESERQEQHFVITR
jgi:hypothetical protein